MITDEITETSAVTQETAVSENPPVIPEVTVSENAVIYDVSLILPDYGEITGTISETHTAEVIKSLEELKSCQQTQNDLLNIVICVMCLLIGAVCGLLLTLHIKRR